MVRFSSDVKTDLLDQEGISRMKVFHVTNSYL